MIIIHLPSDQEGQSFNGAWGECLACGEGKQGGWSADQGHYALGLYRSFSHIKGSKGKGGCVRGTETLIQTDKQRAKHTYT